MAFDRAVAVVVNGDTAVVLVVVVMVVLSKPPPPAPAGAARFRRPWPQRVRLWSVAGLVHIAWLGSVVQSACWDSFVLFVRR